MVGRAVTGPEMSRFWSKVQAHGTLALAAAVRDLRAVESQQAASNAATATRAGGVVPQAMAADG